MQENLCCWGNKKTKAKGKCDFLIVNRLKYLGISAFCIFNIKQPLKMYLLLLFILLLFITIVTDVSLINFEWEHWNSKPTLLVHWFF